MTSRNASSLGLALVIVLVAGACFAINWKLGCIGTAIAIFKVVKLCAGTNGRNGTE